MSFNFATPKFEMLYAFSAIMSEGRTFDKSRAERAVAQMIRMITQKDFGEHLKKDGTREIIGIPAQKNLDRVTWEILHQAISLYMKRNPQEARQMQEVVVRPQSENFKFCKNPREILNDVERR